LILLTDRHGQTLNSWGDKRFITTKQNDLFNKGINWTEPNVGTNSIGTALATGQAVQVLRDEHFLKSNRFMIGSAAPIYNANKDLLGVLDVSSDSYLPQAHTLGMVKLMAQGIENKLIVNVFEDHHFLLIFNTSVDNLDSQWSGLIAFKEDGTIVSANRRAETLLSYELALVNITDIFDLKLTELKNYPEKLTLVLNALGKFRMHGLVKRPNHKEIKTVDFRNINHTKVPLDIIPLDEFGLGDEKIARSINQAKRIIDKDIPILIHGETGVGKEVFVNGLHQTSSRKNNPFIAVNCAAIPNELVESELFGYVKGAFTGANNKGSIGLIRKAHKGTLFLDEIGEMPLKLQGRLLRVLQERIVTPLGSTENYPVDIKLISATNQSLKKNVDAGLFRQDLYYRVSGLNIELPPLRKRSDRIALFHKINHLNRCPLNNQELTEEIIQLFYKHPWPGNVRQLVSVVQIALAMVDDGPIQSWHLPDDFFNDLEQNIIEPTLLDVMPPNDREVIEERNAILNKLNDTSNETLRAYNQNNANISQTAKTLGISRNTLYKRLRELNIK
jgi:transcriptional regulator of acetoin/glycerol metabolism